MKITHITDTHEHYIDVVDGKPLRFLKNLQTGQIEIMADDLALMLGFESVHEMMSDNDVLDLMNEEKELTGKYPFRNVT